MIHRRISPLRPTLILLSALALTVGCGQFRQSRSVEHDSARILKSGTTSKVTSRQAADVKIALARTLEESNQLTEAEATYRDALKSDPRRGDAHQRLAILCDLRGDFKASEKAFAEAIRHDPKNADYHCDRGYSFYVQRRWAEAEASLRHAIAIDARHARSHNNLGLVLARQAHTGEALAEFARAGCDPSDAQANLGLILASEGRLPDAKASYAKAIALKPASTVALKGIKAATSAISGGSSPTSTAVAKTTPVAPRRDDQIRRTSVDRPVNPSDARDR